MTANTTAISATPLPPEFLSGLPHPERCLELAFPLAAIEHPHRGYLTGPLHLRTSPIEAAALALTIEEAVGPTALQEARRLRAHGHTTPDTGVLRRVLSGLQQFPPPHPTRQAPRRADNDRAKQAPPPDRPSALVRTFLAVWPPNRRPVLGRSVPARSLGSTATSGPQPTPPRGLFTRDG